MPPDHAPSHPVYLQIAATIRGRVAAGAIGPGESIPSVRQIATEFVVNPNTAQRAIEHLEREGLVEPRRGLGMFVTARAAAAATTLAESALRHALADALARAASAGLSRAQINAACRDVLNEVMS